MAEDLWYSANGNAEQGLDEAQFRIGGLYIKGLGVSQDYTQAMEWYLKAAEQGLEEAQYRIGILYEDGLGVSQNYSQAMNWYLKAAEQGLGNAQIRIGVLYEDELGVNQDYSKAMEWYRKAAEQGFSLKQMNTIDKPYGYWTLERCMESATQFRTRSRWRQEEPGAYSAAKRNEWLDHCLPVCEYSKPKGYWTLERCLESASEFESKSEWRKCCQTAYQVARKNAWLSICWPENNNGRKPAGYWTLDRCIESAKKFNNRTKWEDGESGAYYAARKKGWLDICLPYTDTDKKPPG